MSLLIVLVNYHGLKLTVDCLDSLKPELVHLPGDTRIGLCENGSGTQEAEALQAAVHDLDLDDHVDLTVLPMNLGFTGGNNAVIAPALSKGTPPDYVFLLNNDTVVQPGSIVALWEFMESHPNVGVAGSRLEHTDGETQLAARRFLTPISEFESQVRWGQISRLLSRWTIAPPERHEPHSTDWVPGAALMFRREVLTEIGLLDEGLYTYFDDVDICLRARRAGWPTWYVPQSRITHLVGKTTGVTAVSTKPKRKPDYWFQARRRYFLKNFGPIQATFADVAAIVGQVIWQARCLVQRRQNPDSRWMIWDYLRHSVLITGFRLREVPNPARREPGGPKDDSQPSHSPEAGNRASQAAPP